METIDKKRESILEKALLRFAHFGINKTTMNEIAEDLAISKPSLYYYFPDKVSLVVAVAERIFEEFFSKLQEITSNSPNVKSALFSAIELKKEFFQKYFMLHIGDATELHLNNEEMQKLIIATRQKEAVIIQGLFDAAISRKELKNTASVAAELYLDSIIGLGMCVMARREKRLLPESQGFEEVLSKQKALTEIFIQGLSN